MEAVDLVISFELYLGPNPELNLLEKPDEVSDCI